jgi:hypothetical protein
MKQKLEMTMRAKLIAAIMAGGCLMGFHAAAVAQDLAEHPSVSTPSEAKKNPNAASEYKDQQAAPANSERETGRPAPGPHESGH